MSDRLRGLWVSDLVVPTGFSRVSHSIIEHLKQDFDITGIGVNYRGDPHKFDFPIFPAYIGGDIYGANRLTEILSRRSFDFLFILNDAWVINAYLSAIKERVKKDLPPILVYFPVDAEEHSEEWYKNFDIVTKAFTYTQFGKNVVKKAAPSLDVGIIPHGTDTKTFYKKFSRRSYARVHLFGEQLTNLGDPEDLFIVLSANRNQPRKRLDIAMRGFSLFAKDKPNTVKLYMHCGIRDQSIDVVRLASRLGIDNRLILSSNNIGLAAFPETLLNDVYNACDVGINTSLGEGWGLVHTEHACTGALQVVPNHSACAELFHDCGMLIEPITDWTFDNSMTVGKLVEPMGVAEALEIAYSDANLRESLADAGMKKFTSEEYSWSRIAKTWKREIEESVNARSKVAI